MSEIEVARNPLIDSWRSSGADESNLVLPCQQEAPEVGFPHSPLNALDVSPVRRVFPELRPACTFRKRKPDGLLDLIEAQDGFRNLLSFKPARQAVVLAHDILQILTNHAAQMTECNAKTPGHRPTGGAA